MKISKKQLRKLIQEAFIGQVGKPPVNVQDYLKNPDIDPALDALMSSGDPEQIRTGLSLHGTLAGDEMAYAIGDASLEDDSFLEKEKPFDKEKNKVKAAISQMESMNLLKGKMFEDYFYIEDYNDLRVSYDFKIMVDGNVIDEIYGLLSQGNDSAAKKVGMNYLSYNGKFFADNPQALEACKEVASFYSATSFADLYYNYLNYSGSLEMSIVGLLPQDVMPLPRQVSSIELSLGQLGELNEEVPASNADAKAKIFRLARALGLLSQPIESHPIGYFFSDGPNILKGYTEIRVNF